MPSAEAKNACGQAYAKQRSHRASSSERVCNAWCNSTEEGATEEADDEAAEDEGVEGEEETSSSGATTQLHGRPALLLQEPCSGKQPLVKRTLIWLACDRAPWRVLRAVSVRMCCVRKEEGTRRERAG
jgi:hypothetical protein